MSGSSSWKDDHRCCGDSRRTTLSGSVFGRFAYFVVGFALCLAGCEQGNSTEQGKLKTAGAPRKASEIHAGTATTKDARQLSSESPEPSSSALFEEKRSRPSADTVRPVFRNVAAERGVDFLFHADVVPDRYLLPEVMGGGAAWFDADQDGRMDLYFVNGTELQSRSPGASPHRNAFLRQTATGSFAVVEPLCHFNRSCFGQGCVVGDYNGDGFPDLYLTAFGSNVLLMNQGDGTFLDVTDEAGVDDPRWSTSGVWVDLDSDGDSDLIVVNYLDVTMENNQICYYGDRKGYCGPGRYDGVPDSVFLNEGDGRFTEQSARLGFNPFAGKGLAIVVADFDQDLSPDIYVGNDMTANFLYSIDRASEVSGSLVYCDIAAEAGCAVSGEGMNEASMGISCADFDGDGMTDLYLTHYHQMKNTLYRNLGNMLFEDDSWRTGVASQSFAYLGFGTVPLDFNGDGATDLFIANGHVLGPSIQPWAMPPQVLQNDGKGSLVDVSGSAGSYFSDTWLGRGAASADFDNDGDTDIAVSHLERNAALLENNTVTGKHFLGLQLEQLSRVTPVGAQVRVSSADSEPGYRIVSAGGSYLSSSDTRLLFPLTADEAMVEIVWPSGQTLKYGPLKADRYWRIMEGRQPEFIPQ